jgi:D-methionine transport system ATP-binding protein
VEVGDGNRIGDVLGTANSRGVAFHLAFGGIEVLQDREFGSITLELMGADTAVDGLLEELRAIAAVEEVAR